MEPKQTTTTSTQQQISDQPWVDCPDGFCSPHQQAMLTEIPRSSRMTAVFYEQNDGKFLTAYSPKPPTPEAVAKAQFVDKTYQWKGAASNKQ